MQKSGITLQRAHTKNKVAPAKGVTGGKVGSSTVGKPEIPRHSGKNNTGNGSIGGIGKNR